MNFKQLSVLALLCFGFGVPFSLLADPMISVDPIEIEMALNTGDVDESSFNITNEGDEDLQFTIRPEFVGQPDEDMNMRSIRQTNNAALSGPRRDELGDIVRQYNLNQAAWSGLAWDGEMMNGIALNGNMVTFDPDGGEIVAQIALNWMCYGLVYQEPFFWTVTLNEDSLSSLVRFNRNGNILEIIETERFGIVGIASDGDNVYFNAFDPQGRRAILHQFSFENGLVRTIDCGNIFQRDELTLEWVEDHNDGHLWAIEWNRGTLSQVDISGDEPRLIQRTQLVQNQMYGFAHDGVNLWYTTMRGDWFVIDDGIRELRWISFDQVDGVLEADADIDIIVILNADNLIEGLYEVDVHILSNDPDNPDVVVSVSLDVIGAPVLEASWLEDIGFPDLINWNQCYMDVFAGGPYRIPVTLMNSGTAELIIESISCENDVFTSRPDNLNLDPGEEVEIDFIFNTDEPGQYEDNMVLVWNNPNEEDFEIRLSAEAVNPPVIVVEPDAIEVDGEEVEEHIINIANDGDEVLRFRIETEIISEPEAIFAEQNSGERQEESRAPYRDDLGDVIDEYDVGQADWGGLAWDGDLIWGINSNQGQLIGYDPDDREIVGNLNLQGQYYGLSYGEDSFWIGAMGQRNARIVNIDLDGNAISTIDVPGMVITGISFDGENLWYYSFDQGNNTIFRQITTEGELLREVDCTNIIPGIVHSLTWVPEHEDGNLWVLSWENGSLYQVNVNEDQPEILQQVQLNPSEGFGLDHDGDDLLYCCQGPSWFKIDDGVSEVRWITVDPTEGEIEPGGDMDIVITLDPTGLIGGMYEAELHILSNDPGNPDVVVAILMEVTGIPVIDVEWPDEFGYPDRVDWNLAHEDLFTGHAYPVTVEVINTGTEDLLVEEITSVSEVFSADQEDFILRPGRSQEVNLWLAAEENGRYESEMIIFSNALNNQELAIPLLAVTNGPPQISVEPNVIESDLEVGSVEEHAINITNNGESILRFTIDHNIIDPEVDSRIRRNLRSSKENKSGPVRDDFGDLLAQYDLNQSIADIAPDGELIWCLGGNNSTIFTFDPATGELGEAVRVEGIFRTLDFDGEFFWLGGFEDGQRNAIIHQMDQNWNILQTINVNGFMVNGISHDGENLWYSSIDFDQGQAIISQITTNGEFLRQVNCANVIQSLMFNLEYVPEHVNGQIWVIDPQRASLMQLDISNEFAEIVQQTEIIGVEEYGIAHDGENIWYSTDGGNLRVLDDGIREERWITYEPVEGEIEPDSDLDVFLTLDATDIEPGEYEADLNISSNDPDDEVVVVNVLLHVEPNSVSDNSDNPVTFNLSSAYPNPFNATTRIEYTLPERTNLSINVYDISGHIVQKLFSGEKSTGTHDIIWDSVDNANGVYLIRLESQHFNAIQKVTLLK